MAVNYNDRTGVLGIDLTPQDDSYQDFAFKPGSLKDNLIKQLYNIEQNTGFSNPKLDQLKQEDMQQFQDKGTPLSLPSDAYTAMAISNYNDLFGPQTFTDALGTTRTRVGLDRPDINTAPFNVNEGVTNTNSFRNMLLDEGTLGEDVKKSIFPLVTTEDIKTGIGTLLNFITPGSFIPRVGEAIFGPPDPRVKVMRDFYGLQPTDAGTIQSGIMKGYNPISGGFLNFITGGRYGSPTNYGLQRSYQKRINMIEDLLARNKYRDPQKKRDLLAKLKEEKRREAMALEKPTIDKAREANPDVYREAERQGFTGPGGGFSTTGREGAFSSKSGRGRQDY